MQHYRTIKLASLETSPRGCVAGPGSPGTVRRWLVQAVIDIMAWSPPANHTPAIIQTLTNAN